MRTVFVVQVFFVFFLSVTDYNTEDDNLEILADDGLIYVDYNIILFFPATNWVTGDVEGWRQRCHVGREAENIVQAVRGIRKRRVSVWQQRNR